MKFSKTFIPTSKEAPKDASLVSHQYLLRGGFVTQEGAGLYNFLPLGKIILEKIKKITKEELDIAGLCEVELSFITPYYLWEQSKRASQMGLEMLKIKDRKNNDFVLSPTNEEAMVNLLKNRVTSYKDLPLHLYQINTKFRDEARPRFGLLRTREFLMKDSYSFHSSKEDLQREFDLMEQTYKKIFTRLGLDFRIVAADSGAIGGSGSKEFMALAKAGEDTLVVCKTCEYGANIEAAKRQKPILKTKSFDEGKILTENKTTIEDLANFLEVEKSQCIKAVIKKAIYEDFNELVIFFISGDCELENTKASSYLGALELVTASEEEIKQANLVAGYCGPFSLPKDIKIVLDEELKDRKDIICGANIKDYHLVKKDFSSLSEANFTDLLSVKAGDKCIKCGSELYHTKGIEAGHIFLLGDKYSKALEANFLDENGKAKAFLMGTYGIGISRLLATIIEQSHDDKGCIWTRATAPYFIDIIVSNAKKTEELEAGIKIYEELKSNGVEVIIDDRKNARFGFKISDFELIGFPFALIIGKKLQDGLVELIDRKTLKKEEININEVSKKIITLAGKNSSS